MCLFDCGKRIYLGTAGHGESHFSFLNRSAWASAATALKTLESWLVGFSEKKKKDIRSRFQGTDQEHHGALLELATQEFLHAVAADVEAEPSFKDRTPDFAATYKGSRVIVKCTVVQETNDDLGATQRENIIKNAVNSIDTGAFHLFWERVEAGPGKPPTKQLRINIKTLVSALDPDEEMLRLNAGCRLRSFVWDRDGWQVELAAIPGKIEGEDDRTIGMEVSGGWRKEDVKLQRALGTKAKNTRKPSKIHLTSSSSVRGSSSQMAVICARLCSGERLLDHASNLLGLKSKPKEYTNSTACLGRHRHRATAMSQQFSTSFG